MFCSGIKHRGDRTAYEFTLSANVSRWHLINDGIGFTPTSPVTVTITVDAGVLVRDTPIGSPARAMNLSGLPAGSTVDLINNGYIQGQGGAGGNGGIFNGSNGSNAGNAILGPGAGITFNVTNSGGRIWGGGGGGGGGGGCQVWIPGDAAYDEFPGGNGAGGGGGAGGSDGGSSTLDAGEDGTSGVSGTFGQGGVGHTGPSSTEGDAGDGGDWGSNGNAGQTGIKHGGPSDGAAAGAGGAAGNAGKAIDLNGGAVNFISGSSSPNVRGAVA